MEVIIKDSLQILSFINKEISFDKLEKDKGIFETNPINGDISIGVSYETEEGKDVYIYNVFDGSEYINVYNRGTMECKVPKEVVEEIKDILAEIYEF